jgi:hypothetical protein
LDSFQELIKKYLKDFIAIHKKYPNFKGTARDFFWMSAYSTMLGPLGNHLGLFVLTIKTHADDEQQGCVMTFGMKHWVTFLFLITCCNTKQKI